MSFFQKMIKIHHQQPQTTPQVQPQTQQQAQNQKNKLYQSKYQKAKISIKSSRRHNQQNNFQQKGWEDIQDEPKIDKVYKSIKINLITPLLPLRQQLLREMIVKKKQFFSKTLINSQIIKKNQFKNRLEQSNIRFQQEIDQIQIRNLDESKASSVNKKKKFSKMSSASIQKSQASNHKSIGCVTTNATAVQHHIKQERPSSDLNKQVMMKLLNLLQKQQNDRNNLMSISINQLSNFQNNQIIKQQKYQKSQKQVKQKEPPIVINNIMRTPMNNIGKEFMQQQMKIRMLQKDRYTKKNTIKKQNNFSSKQLSQLKSLKASEIKQKIIRQYLIDQAENMNTQRSLISHPYQQINQISQSRLNYPSKCISSIQNSKNSSKNNRVKQTIKAQISQYPVVNINLQQDHQNKMKENYYSTNANSQHNSVREFIDNKSQKVKRKRQFHSKNNKQNQPIKTNTFSNIKSEIKHSHQQFKKDEKPQQNIIIKPPVLIEIPLDDNKNTAGMTLAQAFKAKIGKLKSQKQKCTPKNNTNRQLFSQKLISPSIDLNKTKQMHVQSSPLFKNESNFNNMSISPSRNMKSKIITKQSSISKASDNQTAKISRQPSKQLLDRLIYGQKAKISKKQMYSLTKKNYQNLPQVQAKKKEAQKKKIELQRKQKIKDYQSQIRSNKSKKIILK